MNPFIEEKLGNLKLDQCWDVHAHLLGMGDSERSGIYMKQEHHPIKKLKNDIRLAIFKHYTKSNRFPTDESYLDFFAECAENAFPGFKSLAFAFTGFHDHEGLERLSLSDFIIPNEWSKYAAQKSSSLLYVTSIHPGAHDSIEQLKKAKEDGAVALKWLPCAHNINPANKNYVPFYETLASLGLPLITHAGAEHAVHGEQFNQRFGNPLHLRLPLECGVKVIIAHCASHGLDYDFEESHREVPSFDLFKRLMDTKDYDGLIYADISATPQINRAKWLPYLLQRKDWHHKLLNGSDYPLPAIPVLFSLNWLRAVNLISGKDARELGKLKKDNPLLFDFVLKRCLNYKGHKFDDSVFETKRVFV